MGLLYVVDETGGVVSRVCFFSSGAVENRGGGGGGGRWRRLLPTLSSHGEKSRLDPPRMDDIILDRGLIRVVKGEDRAPTTGTNNINETNGGKNRRIIIDLVHCKRD